MSDQVDQATGEYKKAVQGIQTEITKKEDLLAEITKLEDQREAIENDLQSVDQIINDQKKENQSLRQKVEEMSQDFRIKEDSDKRVNI